MQWKNNCQYLLSGFGIGVVLNRLGDSLFILEILEDATFQKTMGEKEDEEEGKEDEENIIQIKLLLDWTYIFPSTSVIPTYLHIKNVNKPFSR